MKDSEDANSTFSDPPPPYELIASRPGPPIASPPTPLRAPTPSPPRQFTIERPALHRHYEISTSRGKYLHYVDVSVYTFDQPDLSLHAGNRDTTKVVAVSKIKKLWTEYKIELGNGMNPRTTKWEKMTKEMIFRDAVCRWEMALPGPAGDERRAFLWKRTHHVVAKGTGIMPLSMRNWKLVDEKTEELLAVFTSNLAAMGDSGTLQSNFEYGADFDYMVFITVLGMNESVRRKEG